MSEIGNLRPYLRGDPAGDQFVGATSKDGDYDGPEAYIEAKGGWLWIVTDEHEGAVMLNIETLPALRKALGRLAKHLAANPRKDR